MQRKQIVVTVPNEMPPALRSKRASQKVTETQLMQKAVKNPLGSMKLLVQGNLFFFLTYFWDEYSQDDFTPNWHIEYICEELEKVARRVGKMKPKKYDIIFNVPPGSTKTAIVCVMFPLWCWVNWFWMRFITASYTSPLSLESAEYSRDIIRSDKFKMMFPEIEVKSDKDTKSNFKIVKNIYGEGGGLKKVLKGGNRFSTSVGGSVTGFHGHIIIWDDPIDPQRAVSETEVAKANHWMDNTLPFRKVNKEVTVTIGIMQRLHQDDPTGHLIKRKGTVGLKHVCIPGEIKNYRDFVKPKKLIKRYTEDGLLDPRRLNWKALKDFQSLGSYTYGGQIGQNPIPLGGGMFKTDEMPIVENMPHHMDIVKIVRYWDKAGTKDGLGAYTAGVKMARLKNGSFLIINAKRGRWASEKRERIMKVTAIADGKNTYIGIEQEPGSGGLESAQATVKNLAGFICRREKPTGDKAARADPFSVQMNEGNVSMLRGDWNKEFVDELKFFPNSTFKDQGDAASGAFNMLVGLKKVKIGGRGRGGNI